MPVRMSSTQKTTAEKSVHSSWSLTVSLTIAWGSLALFAAPVENAYGTSSVPRMSQIAIDYLPLTGTTSQLDWGADLVIGRNAIAGDTALQVDFASTTMGAFYTPLTSALV